MIAESFLFYLFSSIALISGIMVIRSKNPVHSVLFLILVFCNAAGLLILLHLDFFAMIFLVVYVGAIAVLFLFVVMMLHIKLTEMNENVLRYLPVGGIIGLIFVFEVLLIIENDLIPLLLFQNESMFSWIDLFFYKIKGLFIYNIQYPEYIQDLAQYSRNGYSLNEATHLGGSIQDLRAFQSFQYTQWPLKIENITNIEALGQILYTYYFYFFILASLILLIAMIGAIVLTLQKGAQVKRQEVFEQNTREFTKTIRKLR